MRVIGTLLVLLGALVIAVPEIQSTKRETAEQSRAQERADTTSETVAIPPVYGGIALVSGLLVIASSGRRE